MACIDETRNDLRKFDLGEIYIDGFILLAYKKDLPLKGC